MRSRLSTDRATRRVRSALNGRRLIWFGIRGEDGEALLHLPELEASCSITAPLRSGSIHPDSNICLEAISGVRPDLDEYDIDFDREDEAAELRRRLLREVSQRCVVMTYRPSSVVSALAFSMADTMTLAGLHKDRQASFEHKPWVETCLARLGVRGLSWHYVADEHRARVERLLGTGPVVLRASRASGGVGIALVSSTQELEDCWPHESDAFVAVAKYVEDATPINFSGCVFSDGSVRLHPPSVQLIGIPSCTNRRFGYCGNDFAAVKDLDSEILQQADALGRTVAAWLHSEKYIGAFGVDALVHGSHVYFTEVNARFQGSSAISADIAAGIDVPDLFLDHLAAFLGVEPTARDVTLAEWAREQPAVSQVVVHNTSGTIMRAAGGGIPVLPDATRVGLLPRGQWVRAGASLGRLVLSGAVTVSGFEIDEGTGALVRALHGQFQPATRPPSGECA